MPDRIEPSALALVVMLALAFVAGASVGGQTGDATLRDQIVRQDAALFEAFNAHDVDLTMAFFDETLEFFHDQDGLVSYAQALGTTRSLFGSDTDLRRELLPETLEVYPIPNYGAMQLGRHRFCHTENGRPDCGEFGFAHVWERQDRGWRITRVLSYGH